MENKKHTKRALLGSVIAVILCCAMLIGSTFAWFTDTASSGSNVITSGNLDIEVDYTLDGENWMPLDGAKDLFQKGLWEPGHTEVVALKVTNNGSLALKYNANMNIVSETIGKTKDGTDIKLSDILTVSTLTQQANDAMGVGDIALELAFMVENSVAYETPTKFNEAILGNDKSLLPGDSHYVIVKVDMSETVGNEANHDGTNAPSINFGINVLATQTPYEYDSFGNDYDENAAYPVIVDSADELQAALDNAENATISLASNVDYGTVTLGELNNVNIDGADGAKIIVKTDANTKIENVTLSSMNFEYDGTTVDCGVVVDANASIENLVIENSTFTGTGAKAGRGLSGDNNAASIVFSNCTFKDLGYPIYAWGGYESLTIENCTFDNIQSWAIMPQSGFDGDLTVTNCVFKNCIGGGLIKAGTLTAGHTFTFTNNTVTGCTVAGDHNWFQFNVSAGTSVITGNKMEDAEWTPGEAEGLK